MKGAHASLQFKRSRAAGMQMLMCRDESVGRPWGCFAKSSGDLGTTSGVELDGTIMPTSIQPAPLIRNRCLARGFGHFCFCSGPARFLIFLSSPATHVSYFSLKARFSLSLIVCWSLLSSVALWWLFFRSGSTLVICFLSKNTYSLSLILCSSLLFLSVAPCSLCFGRARTSCLIFSS